MGSTFGQLYRFTVFGASHAPEIGVVIEGLPAGTKIDREALRAFLKRRAPGQNEYSTARREADEPIFAEGLDESDLTTGVPLRVVIRNTDIRSADYDAFRTVLRPGHADYPAYVKTGQIPPGGGHWSGRMTAPLCIAGGIARQLLAREGIRVDARIESIAGLHDPDPFTGSTESKMLPVSSSDPLLLKRFQDKISAARAAGDSVGGTVECRITGLPVGLGDHPFDGLENRIAAAVFGIPAVKGIEFGDGFALSALRGSQANDAYHMEDGRVVTATNHCGGVLGGMSDGMPLLFRVAFKPTPTISLPQESVDLTTGETVTLRGKGRHDPCIVPRAVPVVEAAASAALYDLLLTDKKPSGKADLADLRRKIDRADRAILDSFLQRMQTSAEIAAYKSEKKLPVRDEAREDALLKKIAGETSPREWRPYSTALFTTILALSRTEQERIMEAAEADAPGSGSEVTG